MIIFLRQNEQTGKHFNNNKDFNILFTKYISTGI